MVTELSIPYILETVNTNIRCQSNKSSNSPLQRARKRNLRFVTGGAHTSSGPRNSSCPVQCAQAAGWWWCLHPRLRDTAAAFLFAGSTSSNQLAGSTSSKTKHVSQRHSTHMAPTRLVTAFNSTHIQDTHKQQGLTAKSPPPHGLAETEGH